jgi:hypothetical protein
MARSAPLYSLEICVSPRCRAGCWVAPETPTAGRPLPVAESSSSCWQPIASLSRPQSRRLPTLHVTPPSTPRPTVRVPASAHSLTHLLTYSQSASARPTKELPQGGWRNPPRQKKALVQACLGRGCSLGCMHMHMHMHIHMHMRMYMHMSHAHVTCTCTCTCMHMHMSHAHAHAHACACACMRMCM